MDLSIIIPMYNHEKYVEQAITSMLKGITYKVEIIVINDASTDKSLEKINNLQKKIPNIKILQNEKNCGCAYSINKGLEIAKGKYIGINSSDDFVDEYYYQKMLDIAFKENADVVCANIANYNEKTNEITYCKIEEGNIIQETIKYGVNPVQVKSTILLGHWTASSASTKIIKKEYYDKYKFIGTKANDIPCIYPIMALAKKIVYCPNLYKYYRILPKSLSRKDDEESYNSVGESMVKAFELMDDIENSNDEKEVLFFNNCMSYFFNVLLRIEDVKLREKCTKDYYQKLIKYNQNIFREMRKSVYFINFFKLHNININLYTYLENNIIDELLQVVELINQIKVLKSNMKNVEQEKEKLIKENNMVLEKNNIISEENQELKKKNIILNGENEILQKQNKELISECKILNCVNEKLQIEENKIKNENALLLEENANHEKNTLELKKAIQGYEESRSWKLTKPIRKIKQKFSKIRRKK